jgi:hypothetical protein
MRGQAADAGDGNECARALGERWFGNFGIGGSGARVLASRHASMIANACACRADRSCIVAGIVAVLRSRM